MSKAKKPVVGDVVHYVGTAGGHRAAIVIGIDDADAGLVNLAVFNDGSAYGAGPVQATAVFYDEDAQPHTWHWIER